jgi:lysine/ornithine N-monooxygenase
MKATVKVYMKGGGATYEYDLEAATAEELTAKAREHDAAIWATGYRHCANGVFEHYGPHWIDKIKVTGNIITSYPDRCSGT